MIESIPLFPNRKKKRKVLHKDESEYAKSVHFLERANSLHRRHIKLREIILTSILNLGQIFLSYLTGSYFTQIDTLIQLHQYSSMLIYMIRYGKKISKKTND